MKYYILFDKQKKALAVSAQAKRMKGKDNFPKLGNVKKTV
jgi:hypothetical protein